MSARAGPDPNSEKSVAWPDLWGSLERAGALATELAAAAEERARLARRLEAALEVRRESVRQGAALDELSRQLERRRARVDELAVARRRAAEGVEWCKEQMQAQIEWVLPLSRALAAAHRQVQEAKELKSAEKARLGDLQRLLRTRQQSMVAQVAALYPVRVFRDLPTAENHHSRTNVFIRTTTTGSMPTRPSSSPWRTTRTPQAQSALAAASTTTTSSSPTRSMMASGPLSPSAAAAAAPSTAWVGLVGSASLFPISG
ncbi:uncharacterized protein LOC125512744 isoform X2 [Triticum urartu]|nr:uncharacterized protein LOC125512743 isoform X2 [Triticum urartu]XP_048533793.1 uncharacterized protein LOC125512744 isoform X2 [Triticum urartu]